MPKYSQTDNRQKDPWQRRALHRSHRWIVLLMLVALVGGPPACLFKKKKATAPEVVPTGPIQIVFLPANAATDNSELRWMSLAVPVLLTKAAGVSSDLDPVPLWQILPVAVENAGASRVVNPELAGYLASRMGARWAAMSEITLAKSGFTLLVDFIPTKASAYAFRYQKAVSSGTLESNLRQAIDEFLHYQFSEPKIAKESIAETDAGLLRKIAEALDGDYGWFVPPTPGKAESVAAALSQADSKLARLIFSPMLYPIVGSPPAPPPAAIRPVPQMPPPPPESQKPPETSLAAPPSTAVPAERPIPSPEQVQAVPAESEVPIAVAVPPPKTFILRVDRPLSLESAAVRETRDSKNPRGSPAPARAGPPSTPDRASRTPAVGTSIIPSKNPTPPPESLTPQTSQASSFRIQISSLRNRANAEAEVRRLTETGLTALIEEVELGETGIWYRVYLTGFPSRSEALKAAKKLRAESLIHDFLLIPHSEF